MVDKALLYRKLEKIENYLKLVRAKKDPGVRLFKDDKELQSIILFNLIQSIQSCIDIGTHIISDSGWTMPGTQAGVFETLAKEKIISPAMSRKMIQMAGFRNRIVHEYEEVDLSIVHEVWRKHIKDIENFCKAIEAKWRM